MQFSIESYDIINLGPYLLLKMQYQVLGVWGLLFDDAVSLAEIIKFTYLGYQHMFSAEGLSMYQKQQRWDFFNFGKQFGFGPNFGDIRCFGYGLVFKSFHWLHELVFDLDWKFWVGSFGSSCEEGEECPVECEKGEECPEPVEE